MTATVELKLHQWLKQTPRWLKAGLTVVLSMGLIFGFAPAYDLLLNQALLLLGSWAALAASFGFYLEDLSTPLNRQNKLTISVYLAVLQRLAAAALTLCIAFLTTNYLIVGAHYIAGDTLVGGILAIAQIFLAAALMIGTMMLTTWALIRELWHA